MRALPEAFRDQAEAASRAIHIDPTSWDGGSAARAGTPPLLDDVQILINASALNILRARVQNRLHIGAAHADGRIEVEFRGHSIEAAAGDLAGFGNMLEVISPPELRRRLAQVADELLALYR